MSNVLSSKKVSELLHLVVECYSIRAIREKTGIASATIQSYRKKFKQAGLLLDWCKCGNYMFHKGFCSVQRKKRICKKVKEDIEEEIHISQVSGEDILKQISSISAFRIPFEGK